MLRKYRVRSGDIDRVVKAENPEDAAFIAVLIGRFNSLGLIFKVKARRKAAEYIWAEDVLTRAGWKKRGK